MKHNSLEQLLESVGNPVQFLRNAQVGAYNYPVVPGEFSNWRDEQLAWRHSAMLSDQSHHMTEMLVRGRDALKLLSYLAVNSTARFAPNMAKQFAPVSPDGYIIGDGIMFYLGENEFNLVGRAPMINWVQYHAQTGGYDVQTDRDERSASRPGAKQVPRRHYRYQIQGPNSPQILERLNGGPIPEIKFFHLGAITIAGRSVRALRHGMAGAPGLEVWGPFEEGEEVRNAILEAGEGLGLYQLGARAYATNTLESGWIPSPLPAIYSGDKLQDYRRWLPPSGFEGSCAIGGSYVSERIEDYYVTPYELGYGPFIKFDHEFIGREALARRAKEPHRKKVTFAWNAEDVLRVYSRLFTPGSENFKYLDLPLSVYASASYDKVMKGSAMAGLSMFTGYSYNERTILSLGLVDPSINIGDELTLVWGEEHGGTRKPTVERHQQLEIRVRVSPAPFASDVREKYAQGWRTRAAPSQ